jgi:hypothetical protein
MKRIGIILSLSGLLATSVLATAAPLFPVAEVCICSELPWATVDAVLKKVAEQGHYGYTVLMGRYDDGLLTVTQSAGGGYEVRIYDEDGLLDVIHIDNL